MAAWTSSNGVEVDIEPFTSSGWKFTRLTMSEVLGGKIADGKVSLFGNGSEESMELAYGSKATTYINIKLKKSEGVSYDIKAFILSKSWTQNVLDLDFVCVPDRSFFSKPNVLTQADITSSLKQLWPWDNIDIRCSSDANNEVPLQQLGESNYIACEKLAYSFKKNSIFCFGLEGFMIKDLIGKDSFGNSEPKIEVLGDGEVIQGSSLKMNYNFKIYSEAEDPWAGEEYSEKKQSPTLTSLSINNNYYLVSRDHWTFLSNYVHNTNLMESKLYSSLTIITPNTIPNFKIGDTVIYKRSTDKQKYDSDTFTISKMVFFISTEGEKDANGHEFSVTSVLRGVKENGEIMPTDDSFYDSK